MQPSCSRRCNYSKTAFKKKRCTVALQQAQQGTVASPASSLSDYPLNNFEDEQPAPGQNAREKRWARGAHRPGVYTPPRLVIVFLSRCVFFFTFLTLQPDRLTGNWVTKELPEKDPFLHPVNKSERAVICHG